MSDAVRLLARAILVDRFRREHPEHPITDNEAYEIMDRVDNERQSHPQTTASQTADPHAASHSIDHLQETIPLTFKES
jgi:hypothetical protein